MSNQAENWFREKIKDMIVTQAELTGGYLDGTMIGGDEEAGTYKFPIFGGNLETVALSGAIEDVTASDAELTTISMAPTDYEASTWYRKQDLYKMGPKHQDALSKAITRSINRRKDTIKWNALFAFKASVDIGNASTTIDPRYLDQARSEIEAEGEVDELGAVVCPLPQRAFSQLKQYKTWANADYVGPENTPFSKSALQKMRYVEGVHYMALPDAFFTTMDGETSFETFMWSYSSMASETPWNGLPPIMEQVHTKAGSPWLIKAGVGGCAVGLRSACVKRLMFKANKLPERVATLTEAA